jgi:hypothetical protein
VLIIFYTKAWTKKCEENDKMPIPNDMTIHWKPVGAVYDSIINSTIHS